MWLLLVVVCVFFVLGVVVIGVGVIEYLLVR